MATSIKIDDALKSRVQDLASRRDRTSHWIMREAIRQYVEREERRDAFRQEALASWSAYRKTGQHLTGDEVAAWLGSWGTPDERGMFDCHD